MGQPAAKPRQVGTFEALLGNPQILYVAWLENPDLFDPKLGALLHELMSGRDWHALAPDEQQLLDAATVDFAQQRRPQTPAAKPMPELPTKSTEPDDDDGSPDGDSDERDLEWNNVTGKPAAPTTAPQPRVHDIEQLGTTETRWWERR